MNVEESVFVAILMTTPRATLQSSGVPQSSLLNEGTAEELASLASDRLDGPGSVLTALAVALKRRGAGAGGRRYKVGLGSRPQIQCMVYGIWYMVYGIWHTASSAQDIACDNV